MDINAKTLVAAAAVAALFLPIGQAGEANAANKTSAAGSSLEFFGPAEDATLLSTSIKTSPPTDLLFTVSLECALWTTVATVGNDVSEATATVKVWVEFDGVAVPVGEDDAIDTGKVVFCDRTHRQTTTDLDDEDARIEQYMRTRAANAFTWALPDVGGGSQAHLVEVKAELSTSTVGDAASAEAAVGHRTLIVEATHMAQGATVDSGTEDEADAEPADLTGDEGSDGGIVLPALPL